MKFYSQGNQDIFIYKNFINKKCDNGVFVEIGGYDGLTFSNSKFFEETLGFKKIVLIEPTNSYYSMVRNRPNCDCYNYVVSLTEGKELFIGSHTSACSGLLSTMSESHIVAHVKDRTTYEVNTIPFYKLLHRSNLKYIDVLSINVEGGELNILETMDWNIPVYIINIELDGKNLEKDEKCKKILTDNNFTYLTTINNDNFYINTNYFRKNELFDENIRFFGLDSNNNLDIKLIYNNNIFPFMDPNDYHRFYLTLTQDFPNFSSYNKKKPNLNEYHNHIQNIKNNTLLQLSQIGFCLYCDYSIHDRIAGYSFNENCLKELDNGNKLFINCQISNLNYYLQKIIEILEQKNIKLYFYLMDEPNIDHNVINKLLPYSIDIFLQNNTIHDNPKIHLMPIGVADGTELIQTQKYLVDEGLNSREKKYLCLLCFSYSHPERKKCEYILGNKKFVLNLGGNNYGIGVKVPYQLNFEKTHETFYILSPTGCGEATHRFYEAIYFDAIPIVKKTNTPFDKIYNIFPCMVVNDWNDVTEELLLQQKDYYINKLKEFKNKYPTIFTDLDTIFSLLLKT